jgi:hypothetical protein
VVGARGLNARNGPAKSYRAVRTYPANATVQVICYYLGTPSKTSYSSPLPRCAYPYQATATGGLRVRNGPGWSSRVSGRLPYGVVAARLGPMVSGRSEQAWWNLLASAAGGRDRGRPLRGVAVFCCRND